MDSMANDGVESSAESPGAEERQAVSKSSSAATRGRGLRRWRRIRREQQKQQRVAYAAAAVGGGGRGAGASSGSGGGDEDSAQQNKRRLPVPAGAPKVKHRTVPAEEESSTASVRSRFIPEAPAKLDSGLDLLVESAGFSIGADSDNIEDRSGRPSTTASAPRVFPRHNHDAKLLPLEHPRRSLHGKHPRAARSRADRLRVHAAAGSTSTEAENSRSSVESGLRISNASKARHLGGGVAGNGVQKGLSASADHSGEGQPSEDLRSTATGGYNKENGSSVLRRQARRSVDSDDDVRNEQNVVALHSGSDPFAESVLLLQRTQEALLNEIEKFVSLGEVSSDEFDTYDDKPGDSVHLEEPIQEGGETIKHLQSRLEEVSTPVNEKDSRILELGALGRMHRGETAIESTTNLLLSQSELDGLYQKKIEAEIQCIILTRACQTLATPADDQMAIYEAQKSLSEDYRQLGLELRHAENRAVMLEKRAEKLQMQCKELSRGSELLQLQSKATRVLFFCFVQFILLCVAIGTYLMQLVASSTEVVPT